MLPVLLSSIALAADPVALEVVSKAQKGQGTPELVLVVNQDATKLDVEVSCGGATANTHGGASAGERISLPLDARIGKHRCTGSLAAEFSDGSAGEMPLSFEIEVMPALEVSVPRDAIDMEAQTLSVVMDRQPGRVEVQAYGVGNVLLGEASVPALGEGPGQPISVQWPGEGEVIRLHVKAFDADGFWTAVDLLPWYYEIPHEDVVFESGKAEILASEEPKLEAALAEVDKVLAKYGSVAEVKLYVGGYTDTVGDRKLNQRLSQERAAAIARWYRQHGFEGEIYFQGFGEEGQAVATPDNTDQPENRRAVYVLAAEAPPVNPQMPRGMWQKL